VASTLIGTTTAQICYENQHQCFSFAPAPQDAGRFEPEGLSLRSDKLTVTGDIRLRLRAAETDRQHPYADGDQQATRARARLLYQATDHAFALVEFNFSETWAGSDAYSDALVGNNFNGISQAYFDVDDMLGFGDHWRIGRSEYTLANGLILGSCDYLQMPSTFTGAWLSRNFGGHDVEVFVMDDYGPLQFQAANPNAGGLRYFGGTARINICSGEDEEGNPTHGPLDSIRPYLLVGSRDGDRPNEDIWFGADASGVAPGDVHWGASWAMRNVDMGDDLMGWRAHISKQVGLFDGVLDSASYTFTDSEGALHVNPADFNSAGLLHQYGGAWRSDLQTHQLGCEVRPGWDLELGCNLLALDRRGNSPQQGDWEVDVTARKMLVSGVHLFAGYGIDNDQRQVFFLQSQLFF